MRDVVEQLATLAKGEQFENETFTGVCIDAAEYIEELRAKAKRVIDRHDSGTLGSKGDSLSIELLRELITTEPRR